MAGTRSEVAAGGLTCHSGMRRQAQARNPSLDKRCGTMDSGLALRAPRNDCGYYFPPPRVSKNTPCSPNMFHTHQGRFSGTGRP